MTTIGSIGIGLFILIIIWLVTLIVFVLAVRTQSNWGWIALGLATAVTIILVVIPTEKHIKKPQLEDISLEKDYSYIYKNILLSVLIVSACVGFLSFFVLHCIEPVRPKPIKSFYVN